MKFDEQIYEKIDRYLNGTLEGEELEKFEAEKKSNPALADEIELNVQMKAMLSDSPENDLRKNLENLGNQFTEEEKNPIPINRGNSFRYILQVAAVILLAAIAWWVFNQSNQSPDKEAPQIVETPPEQSDDKKVIEKDPSEVTEDPVLVEDEPQQKEEKTPSPNKEPKKKNLPPKENPDQYAANFVVNPQLDFLIDNNLRSNEVEMEIKKRIRNISLGSVEDVVDFQFSGVLKSNENLLNQKFSIHLFSNDKNAFEEFEPISSDELRLRKNADGEYAFDFQKFILLKPGLYYYLLEDTEIEKIYYVEKFEVRL